MGRNKYGIQICDGCRNDIGINDEVLCHNCFIRFRKYYKYRGGAKKMFSRIIMWIGFITGSVVFILGLYATIELIARR